MEAQNASAPCVLITAAGAGTSYGYALALAQLFPQVRLVTADSNRRELVSAACFSDAHHELPPFAPTEAFVDTLQQVIRQEGVTHYLPIIDPEIAFAVLHPDAWGALVLAPRAATAAVAKQQFHERLPAMGLDTPRRIDRAEVLANLPCYAKRDGGFGGRACWRVDHAEDLTAVPADAFFQELVPGREFTADCFAGLDGSRVFCSVRERLEVRNGVCTKARIALHGDMEKAAHGLVQGLGLRGAFCFQAIQTEGGRLAVTDVNPRLGAGTAMSAANGCDFFAAHWAQVFGGDPWKHLRPLRSECCVTRQYVEFLGVE